MYFHFGFSKNTLKKIIKYLIIFIILCILIFYVNSLNVKAETITIGAPRYTIYQNDGTSYTYTGSSIDFWGKDFWRGASNFGVVSSDISFDTQEFFYTNSNWCLGKSLNISGYITGVYNFFSDGGTVQVFNNNKAMNCTYARENSSLVKYSCIGEGGGSFKIAMYRNNASFSYDTGISKSIELSCDDTLSNVIENDKNNTNAIIDNQNKNNEELKDTIDSSLNDCHSNIIPHDNYISSTGEVVINGSNDSVQWLNLGIVTLNPGNYTSIANTGNSDISLIIDSLRQYDTSTTKQFTLTSSLSSRVYIRVSPGTYNNVKFKPAIMTGFTSQYALPGEKKCTSKLDDTNDKLNDLNDSLNNSDISGADDDATNFFNNFNTDDNGGISSIITSPLRLINSLLSNSNSCNDLSLHVSILNNSKDVSLPCGSILWSKAPASTITIYHTIIFGLGAFFILRSLYKDIEDIKHTEDKGVKTTDL